MQIIDDLVVSLHYCVFNERDEAIDSSQGQEPLSYLHGHGQIVPGLERALCGRRAGERLSIVVEAEDAYGIHDPALDLLVERETFPAEVQAQLQPGWSFRSLHPQGDEEMIFTVQRVEADAVAISGNHPLAGERLRFEVDIVAVRQATPDEIGEGHALRPASQSDLVG